jgi:hypothetical protein
MKNVKKAVEEYNEEALVMKGFDDAIIGMCYQYGRHPVVAYDREKVIEILMKKMNRDEAEDFWDYNQIGSWMGEGMPVFIEKFTT